MSESPSFIPILERTLQELSRESDKKSKEEKLRTLLQEIIEADLVECIMYEPEEQSLLVCGTECSFRSQEIEGILGNVFASATPAFFNHIRSEKLYEPEIDNPLDQKLKAQLLFPILQNGEMLGILRASRMIQRSKNFNHQDIKVLESIQNYLINAMHLLENNTALVETNAGEVSEQIRLLKEQSTRFREEANDTMMFLSNTVHDIRTPANSLQGFLELLEEQIDDQKLLKFIQNAKQSAEFINTLTDSILDRVKYDNEARTSAIVKVNAVKFFAGVANIFSANMTKKGIHFLVKIDPVIPKEIKIEKVKLKRILINLIGNAYKFTPKEKTIELKVTYDSAPKRIKIEVKDTGLGIEEERQEEIFKAFQQAKEDTSLHYGGTGLGLAICARYVEELGGDLKLVSKVEAGSNFFFDIPVEIVDASPAYATYQNLDKQITVYTDDPSCIDANLMKWHLKQRGIPEKNIFISNKVKKSTTHLICFEHKLNDGVMKVAEEYGMKLILFEEKLFSLAKQERYKDIPVMSKNNYYGDVLYSTISSRYKPTVLIIDDNRINVNLLESILEGTYCEVVSRYDGESGLKALEGALNKGAPFDILFSDKHMEGINGPEMLQVYRKLEHTAPPGLKPLYAVSISGDTEMPKDERKLYDTVLGKPYKSVDVLKVVDGVLAQL